MPTVLQNVFGNLGQPQRKISFFKRERVGGECESNHPPSSSQLVFYDLSVGRWDKSCRSAVLPEGVISLTCPNSSFGLTTEKHE